MGLLCSSAAANHGAKCQGPSPSLLGVCFISPPLAISLVENRAPVSLDPTHLGSGAPFSLSAVIWGWECAGTAQLCVCWGWDRWKTHFPEGSWWGAALGYCPSAALSGTSSRVRSRAAGRRPQLLQSWSGRCQWKGPVPVPAPGGAASSCPEPRTRPGTGGGGWECGAGGALRGG